MGKLKEFLIFGMVVIFLIGGWYSCEKRTQAVNKQISGETLPEKDNAKLIINESRHTIESLVRVSSRPTSGSNNESSIQRNVSYLSPHASIEVEKNGKVVVINPKSGTKVSPWIGFSYSDTARMALGVDLLYLHNWNAGLSLFPTVSGSFSLRAGPTISWNVWSNTSLFVGVTNQLRPIGGLSLRF